MDARAGIQRQVAAHRDAIRVVVRVVDVVAIGVGHRRHARRHADLEVLGVVRVIVDQARKDDRHVPGVGEGVAVGVFVAGEAGAVVDADRRALAGVIFGTVEDFGVHGAVDLVAVAVVGGDDDQRVRRIRGGPLDGGANRVVKLDQVGECALLVQRVKLLVHTARLDHQVEAVLVLAEHVERAQGHLNHTRLIRKVAQVIGVDVAVEPDIHVAGVEHAEQFLGRPLAHGAGEFFGGGDDGVAGGLILVEEVASVGAAAAGHSLRQHVAAIAPHNYFGQHALVQRRGGQEVTVGAAAGVTEDGSGCGVGPAGRRDDADRHAAGALQQLGQRLLARVIQRIRRGVGVDAQRVHRRLVPGVERAGGVGAVGHDRVDARRLQQADGLHLVHGEVAVRPALRVAAGSDAGRGDRRHAHAVGHKQDDIPGAGAGLRLARVPVDAGRGAAGRHRHGVETGCGQRHLAPDDRLRRRRGILVAEGPACGLRLSAEELGGVFAVDRHGKIVGHRFRVDLDAEVEIGAGQKGRPVDGENEHGRRLVLGRSGQHGQRRHAEEERQQHAGDHLEASGCLGFHVLSLLIQQVKCQPTKSNRPDLVRSM